LAPEERFGRVRQRKSDKADIGAEMPDAQAELARSMDLEPLRGKLSYKT
jgi:hypothetical protein